MTNNDLQHLYWRAGFGVLPNMAKKLMTLEREIVVDELFKNSKYYTPLTIDIEEFTSINPETLKRNSALKTKLARKSRERLKDYNNAWVSRLIKPKELLRERMTLFWANHFVCYDKNIIYTQKYNNTLRTHALGNFRDFVKAISKEAAMINYLNLKQNIKGKPNENFARELMELFTLGVDNYSEEDIKEAAKAFTGYNYEFLGDFKHIENRHDDGFKFFFNKAGRYNGDDIIDIILSNKQCATFICTKIYKYFVNYNLNDSHINEMVSVFFPNYDIKALMQFVFNSDWFYNTENKATKIKSPIEWYVGIQNIIPITFKDKNQVLKIQKLLGQVLLNPPNVAGWLGNQHWIDSNTILLRLKMPTLLLNKSVIPTTYATTIVNKKRFFKVTPKWAVFNTNFKEYSLQAIESNIIQCEITPNTKAFLNTQKTLKKEDYLIQLLSLPEFQMC